MVSRDKMEMNQVWIYIITLIAAAGVGICRPEFSSNLENALSFLLAVLMFGMFTQIPFFRLKEALQDQRFFYALLMMNFIAVPLIVWGLSRFLPTDPALLLGVMLVLLTPCIDYVIVFTHLGRGNAQLILISTPLLFVTQMLLLPLYLWLFMGRQASGIVSAGPFLEAFISFIAIPLILVLLTQWWSNKQAVGTRVLHAAGWLPVPFMAMTLFVIVASQISKLYISPDYVRHAIPVYVAYMIIVPVIARILARMFRLDVGAGRALIFSAGTRNSLVVLPFALALPEGLREGVTVVIVTQTIVELIGELIYVKAVPHLLMRDRPH